MIDKAIPPEETQELEILLDIDESEYPAPTLEWLHYQYQTAAKLRDRIDVPGYEDASEVIGEYRELTPCPRDGRISFKQIGGIRLKTNDISMDDEDLLICRKPVPTGELDGRDNPIFRHEDPTNDPSDFYSALWGHNYDVYRGKILPMNPLNAWNEGFSDPQPWDNENEDFGYGYRGIEVKENDDGEYFRLFSSSRPSYYNNWRVMATYAIAYIGRIPAGTRLEWSVEIFKREDGGWRSEAGSFQIRGWPEGYYSGSYPDDMKEYHNQSIRNTYGDWLTYSGEITIDERYSDLWLAFQQNGSSSSSTYQNIYFRNFQFWRA